MATTDSNGNVSFSGVSAGNHSVAVSCSGFNSQTISISVSGNQTFYVYLVPVSTPPPTTYTITVDVVRSDTQAAVPGATVTLS